MFEQLLFRAQQRAGRPHRGASRTPRLEALEDRIVPAADAVLEWNAIALDAVKSDYAVGVKPQQVGPTHTSRALAIVQAAVFDAVNSIDGSYQPYLTAVQAAPYASIEAAVAQAAHDTLSALYPNFKAFFDADLSADLAKIAPKRAAAGAAVGQAVASAILAARANDGSATDPPYTPISGPGYWQPDPLHPTQKALSPGWGDVTTFVVPDGEFAHPPAPPDLTSADYTAAYAEVKSVGGDGIITPTSRTAEQTTIGIFWGYDGSPNLGVPPRLYNQIATVIANQQHNSEIENARYFALINLAMADGGIGCWDGKYDFNFWRPITAIRAGDTDGNPDTVPDANYTPLGAPADNGNGTNFTPPFPAYTSGHATFGSAAFKSIADFYGTDNIHFSFMSDEFNGVTKDQNGIVRPVVTRSWDTLSQAIEENGQSRIYLGIHWKFDKVEGIRQGSAIADYVFNHALLPVKHGHSSVGGGAASGDAHLGGNSVTVGAPSSLSGLQGTSAITVSGLLASAVSSGHVVVTSTNHDVAPPRSSGPEHVFNTTSARDSHQGASPVGQPQKIANLGSTAHLDKLFSTADLFGTL